MTLTEHLTEANFDLRTRNNASLTNLYPRVLLATHARIRMVRLLLKNLSVFTYFIWNSSVQSHIVFLIRDFRNLGDDFVGNSCFRVRLVLFYINFYYVTKR